MKKIVVLFLFFSSSFLFSDIYNDVEWNKKVNWEDNNIEIRVKTPLDKSSGTLAAARIKSENWVHENQTNIFFKNILDVQINSLEDVSTIINRDPSIYYKLDELVEKVEPYQKNLTTNLEYLESIYLLPLYPDFVSVFYNQSQFVKIPKKLDHIDYGQFTGLIIYVPPTLPLYGKNSDGSLKKVLFPRIFDEDMNLILDYTKVDPEYMKKWGMVIYGESFNEELYQSRIGITPLRIIARGLFGKSNSDIIISKEEANKLIGTDGNLKIITQSRILILN
ncbi:hypothetical protein EW093_04255 [Thiospirochaeta perfilievii]|uniref:Uncharacterized protein n=1 Tax=Thiospirochaeta perfilievii TaxID=252967 RepID=A0A5C1QBA6_9SPIO|nr:hypothetical protein [Thiospirochaeta perfilievii]QEN03944.1 hypothetical protein EW093_04255 [Thiospirochaeta perfilievii]